MLLLHYNTLLSSALLHDHSILDTNYIQLILIILVNTFSLPFRDIAIMWVVCILLTVCLRL